MKYFGFLTRFVVVPLLILRFLIWRDRKRGKDLPQHLQSWPEDAVLLAHVLTAVTYTTPWDNYLVASKVWWYDPDLVTGKTIGWVPIEEYSFFVLQTLMTGSWMQYLARRVDTPESESTQTHPIARTAATGVLALLWLKSMQGLFSGDDEDRYRNLILGWALPPIMLQVGFGGDILWRHRKLVAASILPATAYLGATDSLAIGSGTWTINPEKTTETEVINNLPFEELLFFFVTNVLLVFGVTLVQAKESEKRLPTALQEPYYALKRRWTGKQG